MIRKHSPGTRATEKFSVTRRQQQLASLLCWLTTSSNARPRTAAKQYRSLAPAARNKHAPSPQRNVPSRPPPDPQPPQHSSADRGRAGTRQKSSQKALADGTGDGSAPDRQPASARRERAARLSVRAHELTEPGPLRRSPASRSPTRAGSTGWEGRKRGRRRGGRKRRGGRSRSWKRCRRPRLRLGVGGTGACLRGFVGKGITWVNESF